MHRILKEKPIFNQENVLEKIDMYLQAKGEKPFFKRSRGYCHGLALLWIIKMSTREEEWFYNLIHKIALFSKETLTSIIQSNPKDKLFVSDFDKFINHIEWAQRSERYSNVDQTDIDKILDVPSRIYEKKRLNLSGLATHLKHVFSRSEFAVVSAQGRGGAHSVAVFFRDNLYYTYDANYVEGKGKSFSSIENLAAEIQQRLAKPLNERGMSVSFYEFFYSSYLKTLQLLDEKKAQPPVEFKPIIVEPAELKKEIKPIVLDESHSVFAKSHKHLKTHVVNVVDHGGKSRVYIR